jgi:tRNA A-37 threonylcarbamoyl transferase component Bud32
MAEGTTLRRGNVRVTVLRPTSLVDGTGDARDAFERVWARLPPFEEDNSFTSLDEDGGVFLKGQRIRPRFHWETPLQTGRLVRETRCLLRMHAAGVAVPEVLAHGVVRRAGLSMRAFVLLRLLHGAEDLRALVDRTGPAERAELWEPVGGVVARMHGAGLYHRDLTARNLLVRRTKGAVVVHVIDCPRAASARLSSRRSYLRRSDLYRLARSLRRCGATDPELRTLLRAAGYADTGVAELLDRVGPVVGPGSDRSLRTKLWVTFGV